MIDSFPLVTRALQAVDFSRFSESFAAIFRQNLPTIEQLVFAGSEARMRQLFRGDQRLPRLLELRKELLSKDLSVAVDGQVLLMAFPVEDGEPMLAVATDLDPVFGQRVDKEWLSGVRSTVEGLCRLLKQARVDTQTGLLNLNNLEHLLAGHLRQGVPLRLLLIELPSRRSSVAHTFSHVRKCAALLRNFLRSDSAALHFLGQSLFALVIPAEKSSDELQVERRLVAYLKREGCHRVHIGSSLSGDVDTDESGAVLAAAWQTLRHAASRGPFSFCSYHLLAHPQQHPLARPPAALARQLSRLWRRADKFSVVLFRSDNAQPAAEIIPGLCSPGKMVAVGDDALVFLDEMDGIDALGWARRTIDQIRSTESSRQISAGVSSYPYRDFPRSEMAVNCRKALLHAAFFGSSSCALFDAVSLNISGDVYFSEGNLAKALREYQQGLLCDAANVNLHNSLGVALAMINRLVPARTCFEQALSLDPGNFMALFNIGLLEQARKRLEQAYIYLERALNHFDTEAGSEELRRELYLQLGILASETGRYRQALQFLQIWRQDEPARQPDRACYHAGRAHYGLGMNELAMAELQRALRFDESDARAMNLLARVYLHAGEGDDIALALGKKSVEVEPRNPAYRLHLAEIQVQCGLFSQAAENARRSLNSKEYRGTARLLLARVNAASGRIAQARGWFTKVMSQPDLPAQLHEAARIGLAAMQGKPAGDMADNRR